MRLGKSGAPQQVIGGAAHATDMSCPALPLPPSLNIWLFNAGSLCWQLTRQVAQSDSAMTTFTHSLVVGRGKGGFQSGVYVKGRQAKVVC